MTAQVFAPAKINLTLHVTGQRADGYHLIDSIIGFAGVGDSVTVAAQRDAGLAVIGPEAGNVPVDGSNLVTRIADTFWPDHSLQIILEKNLPVASGIGGGSADAAACYRAIVQLVGPSKVAHPMQALLAMGADIPVCIDSVPAHVGGIGEQITALDNFPTLALVLVNPRVQLSTTAVFGALVHHDNAPMEALPMDLSDAVVFIEWLNIQRNDLQIAAISLAPQIGQVLAAIEATEGCRLGRMSGSGASCYGIYDSAEKALGAAMKLRVQHPHWWVVSTVLNGSTVSN